MRSKEFFGSTGDLNIFTLAFRHSRDFSRHGYICKYVSVALLFLLLLLLLFVVCLVVCLFVCLFFVVVCFFVCFFVCLFVCLFACLFLKFCVVLLHCTAMISCDFFKQKPRHCGGLSDLGSQGQCWYWIPRSTLKLLHCMKLPKKGWGGVDIYPRKIHGVLTGCFSNWKPTILAKPQAFLLGGKA